MTKKFINGMDLFMEMQGSPYKTIGGLTTYDEVVKALESKKSWWEVKGLISIKELFEDCDTSYLGEFLTPDEIEKMLLDEERQNEWYLHSHDNSYNWSSVLERDIDYKIYKNAKTDEELIFISVHVGDDIRAGYLKQFTLYYDNASEYGSDFDYILGHGFYIAEVAFKDLYNEEQYFTIYARPSSEIYEIDMNETYEYMNFEVYDIDFTTKKDFIESMETFLTDNDIKFIKGSIEIGE